MPGALVAVVAAVGVNQLLKTFAPDLQVLPKHLVKLPVLSSLGQLANEMIFPDFSALRNPATYGVAFTIAIVASLETLLSVEAVDNLDPQKRHTPTNRELLAQGAGNLVSGLLGGLPLTAVIVRSSANIAAGCANQAVGLYSWAAAAHQPAVSGLGAEPDSAVGAGGGAAAGGLQADHAGPLPQAVEAGLGAVPALHHHHRGRALH